MRDTKEYTIWNSVTPQAVTSSTSASPTVITKASHGYVTGDRIIINGHATNTAANGIWDVVRVDANTFKIKNIHTGVEVNGNGVGSGGVMALAPKVIYCEEFRDAVITVITAGTATMTLKAAGSIGKLLEDQTAISGDTPNFGATQNDTNPYTFVEVVDLDTGDAIDGSTGVAASGTDINKLYEVNINGLKYFTVIPTAWTAGSVTVKIKLFTNNS